MNRSLARRALALAAGTALATAAALAVAAPASAHHSIVSGDCARGADGTWTVTWTVANSEDDIPATLKTVVSDPAADLAVIRPGAEVPAGGELTDTQVVPADRDSATLTVSAEWVRDGRTIGEKGGKPATGKVHLNDEECTPAPPTPTPSPTAEPTPTPIPTATPTAVPTPVPTATPAPGGGGGLPVTGASVGGTIAAALVLLLVGAGLFLFARRRRVRFTA